MMIGLPGKIFTPDFPYDPRFPYGQDTSLKVVSLVASEPIPAGSLVQNISGSDLVRVARDANRLIGVATYDPRRHSSAVVYSAMDVLPVLRRGSIFVPYSSTLRDPFPMEDARWNSLGFFTTDNLGSFLLPRIVYSIATKRQYQGVYQYPQADITAAVPPVPNEATSTLYGNGTALVEVNL